MQSRIHECPAHLIKRRSTHHAVRKPVLAWLQLLRKFPRRSALCLALCLACVTSSLASSSMLNQGAVFTQYNLTPGGGEKYLLSAAAAMQTWGFFVDVLVQPDNVCQAARCVLDVAQALRVPLDPLRFRVQVVHREVYKLFAGPYEVFFAMGNEKYPPAVPIGKINFFMCQFPFDLDRVAPVGAATYMLAGYDAVLLNSHYSLRWYYTYSEPMFDEVRAADLLFPRMHVLYPPVTLPAANSTANPAKEHIVMVGRFFAGRQSKGHPQAIKIFADLVHSLPKTTKLIMVGNPMPGHSGYLDDLKSLIFSLGLNDRVDIVLAAPPERVVHIQKQALVQWHLTGLGVTDDPASLEHFGISVVEGMSTGAIPVAYLGGAADAVRHGVDGFIANSAERVTDYTKRIFAMSPAAQRAMQKRCQIRAREFQYAQFLRRFSELYSSIELIKPLKTNENHMSKTHVNKLRN